MRSKTNAQMESRGSQDIIRSEEATVGSQRVTQILQCRGSSRSIVNPQAFKVGTPFLNSQRSRHLQQSQNMGILTRFHRNFCGMFVSIKISLAELTLLPQCPFYDFNSVYISHLLFIITPPAAPVASYTPSPSCLWM